jgi:hypothetical protein
MSIEFALQLSSSQCVLESVALYPGRTAGNLRHLFISHPERADGACGVDESQIVAQVASDLGWQFLDIRAVQLDPVDLRCRSTAAPFSRPQVQPCSHHLLRNSPYQYPSRPRFDCTGHDKIQFSPVVRSACGHDHPTRLRLFLISFKDQ